MLILLDKGKVVVGRDARISGEMVNQIVTGTLLAKGFDVIDIGICPTPTVQFTVKKLKGTGGIAISASHNPNEWNALKLLNNTGQFMSPDENTVQMQNYLKNEQRLLNLGINWESEHEYSEGLTKSYKCMF